MNYEVKQEERYATRPSVCRNCGALVGAGERQCAQCGAPVTGAAPAVAADDHQRPLTPEERETMQFAQALFRRPATFTFIFLIANVIAYLLIALSGGPETGVLESFGAKVNYLIDQQGQWWRFVTPIFLHGSTLHLIFNMYGLWILGPYVERLYGSAKFVVFWTLTGIAGVVASYLTVRPDLATPDSIINSFLFKSADVPSVGASGALFGLIGVLLVFGIKFRHELPEGFKRAFGTGMLPVILINLFIGFVGRGFIDNAAHLGGLAAGMLLALFIGYKRIGTRAPVAVAWHSLQALSLLLVVASFGLVWLNYAGPRPSLSDPAAVANPLRDQLVLPVYSNAIERGNKALILALNGDAANIPAAIETLGNVPPLDETGDQLRLSLIELLRRANQLTAATPNNNDAQRAQAGNRESLIADYQLWILRYVQWGQPRGLVRVEQNTAPADRAPDNSDADRQR